ncbi:hypothetical protein AB6N24_18225 [Cellulomonas sp. 179-A 4D5 NHS]|uniref:hypothetical protein n=1 Tax=Cellulomonas sp. 179-A 4D5 NHS TaxID=3142378 RepID=UPI0039A08286
MSDRAALPGPTETDPTTGGAERRRALRPWCLNGQRCRGQGSPPRRAPREDVAPIPGTRRVARVEENTAADAVELTPDQLRRLDGLQPAAGDRHDESNMATIDR